MVYIISKLNSLFASNVGKNVHVDCWSAKWFLIVLVKVVKQVVRNGLCYRQQDHCKISLVRKYVYRPSSIIVKRLCVNVTFNSIMNAQYVRLLLWSSNGSNDRWTRFLGNLSNLNLVSYLYEEIWGRTSKSYQSNVLVKLFTK